MAEVDVTDVLIDSDVAGDSFSVLRRQEYVDDYGISRVVTKTILDVLGSVQPTGDNSLTRDQAYDVQAKTLKIITQFRLRGVSVSSSDSQYKPDQIQWNDDTYEVRVVDDYSLFGGGFVEAECVQIDYVGTPPAALLPSGVVGQLDFSQAANSGYAMGAS